MTDKSLYDPLKVDAYAGHLASVNKVQSVIATENICNEQCAILIPKGQAISAEATEKIVRFKLIRPLHDTVSIEGELNDASLYKALMDAIKKTPDLLSMHNQFNLDSIIRMQCHCYNQFPILRQKLTVLSIQLPKTFANALTSSWLCSLIGFRMKLSDDDLNALFLASLTHDFGMLHIDPEILDKKGDLSPEEWRQIHAHVVIGQKILEEIEGLPKATARAVLEHHERCDGTGYPTQRDGSRLGLLGQIIAMTDSVIAIYTNRFIKENRSIREIIPILQVNNEAHFYKTYETIVMILRQSDLPPSKVISDEEIPALIDRFNEEGNAMNLRLGIAEGVMSELETDEKNRKLTALHNVHRLIMNVVNGAGILSDSYTRWLDQVKKEQLAFAYQEAEDATQMLKELQFHMKRLTRMLHIYAKNNCKDKDTHALIVGSLKKLSQVDASLMKTPALTE